MEELIPSVLDPSIHSFIRVSIAFVASISAQVVNSSENFTAHDQEHGNPKNN